MLPIGFNLGGNLVLKQLGNGAFGFVFCVQNEENIRCAAKVCAPNAQQTDIDRFKQENIILHKLKCHPNIILPHSEVAASPDYLFYLMELADYNLSEYVALKDSSLTEIEKIKILIDIATGLNHAHKSGIIHRDLWWNNVLIKREGDDDKLKITDFGRAKDFNLLNISTIPQECWGIVLVQSPEIVFSVFESPALDDYIPADIYALGIIAHFLFNGYPTLYYHRLTSSMLNFLKDRNVGDITSQNYEDRKELYNSWLKEFDASILGELKISVGDYNINLVMNDLIQKMCNPSYLDRVSLPDLISELNKIT